MPAPFATVGNRVESSWSYEKGTIVKVVSSFEVLVKWDESSLETLCTVFDIEPVL